jgi:serine protease Do
MGHLRDKGTVTRGWLGVQIQTVTPELAESLGLPEARGALIAGVFKGDPADEAGIRVGDVVVEFDGKAVETDRDLVSLVGSTLVGKKAVVKVIRDGKEVPLKVDIAKRVDDDEEGGGEEGDEDSLQPFALGIKVQDLTEDLVERFGLDDGKGILVTEVESGSAADKAGVSRGDIVVEAGRSPVTNIKDFRKALKGVKKGEPLLLLVKRGQGNLFLVVKPEKEKD